MDVLYVVIPAYNEAANIRRTVNEWYPVVEKHNEEGLSRLVIINDGSRDQTYDIVIEEKKRRPFLIALTKQNGGHGSAVIAGYRYALAHGADYIFQTDADGQTNPDEFESFWNRRAEYDAVFGNRTDRRDGVSRVLVERILCFILRIYFHVGIPDSNAPFRLMKSQYVKDYLPRLPSDDYNLPNVMMTTFGVYDQKNVAFMPVSFRPRQGGTNSINIKKILLIGRRALGDFRRFRKNMEGNRLRSGQARFPRRARKTREKQQTPASRSCYTC